MDFGLGLVTGLKVLPRKLVVYWTLATHTLPYLNTFPLLGLRGRMGTGKSQALKIIAAFAHQPLLLSLRGMTLPTIRDEFADCYEGTVIIEEADQAWRDGEMTFERLLSDRYHRTSAKTAHKVPAGKNEWATVKNNYFGATVLHRRVTFKDPALDGRTVLVSFRADTSRTYEEYSDDDPWIVEGSQLVSGVTFALPSVTQPIGIAARVFNTYAPLLGMANLCGDGEFADLVLQRLQQETLELKEAQGKEPDGLVLKAIVEAILGKGRPDFTNIKYSSLSEAIFRNHKIALEPRQIGPFARELGFETKTSHGVTVVSPSPTALLKACAECDYTDEGIDELRESLIKPGR